MMRILMEGGGIYQYLQNVQAYISPPIAAVFLFGLFFRRIHARAAMASLWTGFALGLGRLLLEVLAGKGIWSLPQSSLLSALVQMNFLHYAIFIFLICTIVLFLVGYRSAAKESVDESLIFKKSNIALWSEQKVNFILSISLILLVIFIWLTFSKWGVA
jgi:SSS family solute:Na+ symporter